MTYADTKRAILVPSLIWLAVIATAFAAALLRGIDPLDLAGPALIGALPAMLSVLLSFFIEKEWAQILVLLSWLALAIITCLFVGVVPLAQRVDPAPAAAPRVAAYLP